MYFPEADVNWDLFAPNDHHSICPFKGEADYWTLTANDAAEENLVWTYRQPFDEVAGIKGYVAFYHERVRIELEERWPGTDRDAVTTQRFPAWGDANDLLELIDVQEVAPNHFVGPAYRDVSRNVVEGGQMLAQAIVAASKTVPASTRDVCVHDLLEGGRVRPAARRERRGAATRPDVLDGRGAGGARGRVAQRRPPPARCRRAPT